MNMTPANFMLNALIIVAVWGWGLTQLPELPEHMPIHFNASGQADGFTGKTFAVSVIPVIALLVLTFTWLMGKFTKQGWGSHNERHLAKFELAMTCFLMFVHILIIMEGKHPEANIFASSFMPAICLLMAVFGNYLGKLEKNCFVGIRLPWTLRSDENWRKTHRFSGKLFVTCSLLALLLFLIGVPMIVSIAMIIGMFPVSIVYSYRYYLTHEKGK